MDFCWWQHEPFESKEAAIQKGTDIHSETMIVKRVVERRLVGDTVSVWKLRGQVHDLEVLLAAYRNGTLKKKYKSEFLKNDGLENET